MRSPEGLKNIRISTTSITLYIIASKQIDMFIIIGYYGYSSM